MEIEYKGANCIVIKTKQATIVVDPKLDGLGLKNQDAKTTAQLLTQSDFGVKSEDALVLEGPGEYEVSNISIVGVAAQRHIDLPDDRKQATMYRVDTGDVTIAVVGHVACPLSEEQLEQLGVVDIAVVPVGGGGYTLDAHEAVQIVRQLDPKLVIPTHYEDEAVKYEVPQADVQEFIKELGAAVEEMPKLKIKGEMATEALSVTLLQRVA